MSETIKPVPYPRMTHNDVAAICRDVLTGRGIDPNKNDWLIYRFAEGYNGVRARESVVECFLSHLPAER